METNVPHLREILNIMERSRGYADMGKMTAEEAMKNAIREINNLLRQAR